ncbi:hypothetical protein BMETH_2523_1 [methanotrophic bacterial endosymbiont of Bathymodiolus sp.]|nr:hypothetical protein BMETH_2523_1 [methanotrophic bacterial endosymbiont of Bathymodiolus sp.]
MFCHDSLALMQTLNILHIVGVCDNGISTVHILFL